MEVYMSFFRQEQREPARGSHSKHAQPTIPQK